MIKIERHALKFLAHMNMFSRYYLENKKLTFLSCIPNGVNTAILESLENKNLFQNCQTYFCRILEKFLA